MKSGEEGGHSSTPRRRFVNN